MRQRNLKLISKPSIVQQGNNLPVWTVPRIWENGDCWIIGGGTSLPKQFGVPHGIIQQVMNGELAVTAYSPYMEAIHEKHVIGTNVAYKLGKWIDVTYFCDLPFFRMNWEWIMQTGSIVVTDTSNLPQDERKPMHERVKKLKRDTADGLSTIPQHLRWNHNAGAGAINLATLFGAKRILLLGFDMQADSNGSTHFHKGLPNYAYPTLDKVFGRFNKVFPAIATAAKELGVEILNVNTDSAIECFEKVTLNEVL